MIMTSEVDLSLLRTFVAIVESGGLTAAGRVVGRTQPAVSQQAKRLEEAVGRPLFGPDKRRLELTREGEVLLEYARDMLRLNDELKARFAGPPVEGIVKLGTPDLYAAYLLPEILGSFSRQYPGVEIELRCQRSVNLMSALAEGEIDLALLTRQPALKASVVARREPLVWVAGQSAWPEREAVLPLALMPPGSVYRQAALEALGKAGLRWVQTSMSDSIAGLQAAVYAGLAMTVLPRCAVSAAMRVLDAGESMPRLPSIDLVMARSRASRNAAAEQLADYIAQRLDKVRPFRPRE